MLDSAAAAQIAQLETNCREFGIELHALGSERAGHRARHRAGAGADPAGHDHRLRRQPHQHARRVRRAGVRHRHQRGGARAGDAVPAAAARPRRWPSRVDGKLQPGVTAKDIILALIARLGIGGGTGHVIEYRGSAIRALSMEERMTVCNMSIEAGARAGMIAPDETTFAVPGRPPARAEGRRLGRGGGRVAAAADRRRARPSTARRRSTPSTLEPMITYGTNPGMGIPITRRRSRAPTERAPTAKALGYMGLDGGQAAAGPAHRRGLHRQLHQLAHLRPARGGRRASRAARCADGVRVHGGARLAAGQEAGRGRGAGPRSSATRAPTGARPAARCASR